MGASGLGRSAPDGFRRLHRSIELGRGDDVLRRARAGLLEWAPHRGAGLRVHPERPEIEVGVTVVQAIGIAGVSSIAACRIVEVVDDEHRFGFAYATLPAHPMVGDEAFVISSTPDGSVQFSVTSVSRPSLLAIRVLAPVAGYIQGFVARRYLEGMRRYVER